MDPHGRTTTLRLGDMTIDVRAGTVEDVPLLLSSIRDMAVFEKLDVTATEEILRESLFGERPIAHTLFAYIDGQPAAYVVYFFTISTGHQTRGRPLPVAEPFAGPARSRIENIQYPTRNIQ